jgi:glycosyltransferase involved in cell wall biosynthesis
MALEAFLSKGWTVATVAALQTKEVESSPFPTLKVFLPEKGDNLGLMQVEKAIAEFEPDVIYATGEPGSITAFAHVCPSRIPFLAYVPIEGEPLAYADWRGILKTINFFTCSDYGARIAQRDLGKSVDMVYHGVDHNVFYPDAERRETVRRQLGWDESFIVMTVGANVRRKQHPRLFEAIAILRDQFKQTDVRLYAHTVPFQRHWLEGWHLPQVADAYGVHDEVMFNPFLTGYGASVPEGTVGDVPGLADLYRAADLFVLPSQVEGFGLPIAESMASGTPVVVTKYAAGWEVASPAGVGLEVRDWETAKNGTRYANVDPMEIAKTIRSLKRDPKRLARMSAAGIERARDFDWDAFKEYVVVAVEKAREDGGIPQGEPLVQEVA